MKRGVGLGVLTILGCSLLVEPSTEPRCTIESGCPAGLRCVVAVDAEFGRCTDECTEMRDEVCNDADDDCDGTIDEGLELIVEICNGIDEDCDRRVDEGNAIEGMGGPGVDTLEESFDPDGDTFNNCGSQDCTDPDVTCEVDPARADCGPEDESVFPGAPEVCDGTDHDCDGDAFPDGPPDASCVAPRDVLCGENMVCETDVGCVPRDCASGRPCLDCNDSSVCELVGTVQECVPRLCDPADCAADEYCPSGMVEECVMRKRNGDGCSRDEECLSSYCAPGEQVGLSGGVCFEPCCRDTECAADEYCWGPGTGARTCLSTAFDFSSITGRTTLGTGAAGAGCSSGTDCRSGRCDGSTCFGACGLSADCPESCGLTDEGLGCRSGGDVGDPCTSNGQCAVEACSNTGTDDICVSESCTESASCTRVGGLDTYCAYFRYGSMGVISACDYDEPGDFLVENRGYGETCQVNFCPTFEDCCGGILCFDGQVRFGCDSRTCVNNRCTQACCSDASCPGSDVCRPQRVTIEGGTFYPMFCVPPSTT